MGWRIFRAIQCFHKASKQLTWQRQTGVQHTIDCNRSCTPKRCSENTKVTEQCKLNMFFAWTFCPFRHLTCRAAIIFGSVKNMTTLIGGVTTMGILCQVQERVPLGVFFVFYLCSGYNSIATGDAAKRKGKQNEQSFKVQLECCWRWSSPHQAECACCLCQ